MKDRPPFHLSPPSPCLPLSMPQLRMSHFLKSNWKPEQRNLSQMSFKMIRLFCPSPFPCARVEKGGKKCITWCHVVNLIQKNGPKNKARNELCCTWDDKKFSSSCAATKQFMMQLWKRTIAQLLSLLWWEGLKRKTMNLWCAIWETSSIPLLIWRGGGGWARYTRKEESRQQALRKMRHPCLRAVIFDV